MKKKLSRSILVLCFGGIVIGLLLQCGLPRSTLQTRDPSWADVPDSLDLQYVILEGPQMSDLRKKEFDRQFAEFRSLLPNASSAGPASSREIRVFFKMSAQPAAYRGLGSLQYSRAKLVGEIQLFDSANGKTLWKSEFMSDRFHDIFLRGEPYLTPGDAPFDAALIDDPSFYMEQGVTFSDRFFQLMYMLYGPRFLEKIIQTEKEYFVKSAVRAITVDTDVGVDFAKRILSLPKLDSSRRGWIISALSFDRDQEEALEFVLSLQIEKTHRLKYLTALQQFQDIRAIRRVYELAASDDDSSALYALSQQTRKYYKTISEYKSEFPPE